MLQWIKKNHKTIITGIVTVCLCLWLYACDSQVRSLDGSGTLVNRAELQLELDTFIGSAQLRMLDLDRQDAFRAIVIENSLLLVQGQPFNALGLLTSIFGIYGLTHATSKVTCYCKKCQDKRKANNG